MSLCAEVRQNDGKSPTEEGRELRSEHGCALASVHWPVMRMDRERIGKPRACLKHQIFPEAPRHDAPVREKYFR